MEEKLFVAEVYDFVAKNAVGNEFSFTELSEVRVRYDYGLKLVELVTSELDIKLFNFIYGKDKTESEILFDLKGESRLGRVFRNGVKEDVPVSMDIKKARFIKHKMLADNNKGTTGNRVMITLEVHGEIRIDLVELDKGKLW